MKSAFIFVKDPPSSSKRKGPAWLTIDECIRLKIDVSSEYSSAKRLFQDLFDGDALELNTILAQTTSINMETSLDEIHRLFTQLSSRLSRLHTKKASNEVKQLQTKAILPVISNEQERSTPTYDSLVRPDDKGACYIADRQYLRESFLGSVPILAFECFGIEPMKDLLEALQIDSMRLSKLITERSMPKRPLRSSTEMRKYFAVRMPFIAALVPKLDPIRGKICDSLQNVVFYVSSDIVETYKFNRSGINVTGRPGHGDVSVQFSEERVQLFAKGQRQYIPQLLKKITEHCHIRDPEHLSLIYAVFNEKDLQKAKNLFARHGIFVELKAKKARREDENRNWYFDLNHVPMPLSGSESSDASTQSDVDDPESDETDTFDSDIRSSNHFQTSNSTYTRNDHQVPKRRPPKSRRDPRLPFASPAPGVKLVKNEDSASAHLQYIGERLVSGLLESNLGSEYEPDKHWTSTFRERAGLERLVDSDPHAAFTLTGASVFAKFCELLSDDTQIWRLALSPPVPTIHIDVAVSAGTAKNAVAFTTEQIDRMRKYSLPNDEHIQVSDVSILIYLSNVYRSSSAQVQFIVDPWILFECGAIKWNQNYPVRMTVDRDTLLRLHVADCQPFSMDQPLFTVDTEPADFPPEDEIIVQPPDGLFQKEPVFNAPLKPPDLALLDLRRDWDGGFEIDHDFHEPPHPSEYSSSYAYDHTLLSAMDTNADYSNAYFDYTSLLAQNHGPKSLLDLSTFNRTASNDLEDIQTIREYTYTGLANNCIRLLLLYPGFSCEPLNGILYSVPIKKPGIFRTLSYVWGAGDERKRELTTPDGTLWLRDSLHSALVRIRNASHSCVLWADAICINQNDLEEKASQIPLLPQIYQSAYCTLGFLNDKRLSDGAIEALSDISALATRNKDRWQSSWRFSRLASSLREPDKPVPEGEEDLTQPDLAQVFENSWFRRAWVIQEIVVSPNLNIIGGSYEIEWDDVATVVDKINDQGPTSNTKIGPLETFLRLDSLRKWRSKKARWPLIRLLETFRHVESTLKRDRFFSLLAIAGDSDDARFEPDYQCAFQDIVIKFAMSFVGPDALYKSALQLFYRAGLGSAPERFPSWIPDWTIERQPSLYSSSDRGRIYNASDGRKECVSRINDTTELSVEGFIIDAIGRISKERNEPKRHDQYFKEVDDMLDLVSSKYLAEDLEEMRWRIPIAGADSPAVLAYGDVEVYDSYKAFRTNLRKAKYNKKKKNESQQPANQASSRASQMSNYDKGMNYWSLLDGPVRGWRFAMTNNRRLCGIVPGNAKVGDKIVIFSGGDLPFVVRKSDVKEGAHRLVGESYFHGIMYGEAMAFPGLKQSDVRLH